MKAKVALAAVLCAGLVFALGASPASAAKVSPKQAAGKCKSALKSDAVTFHARYGAKNKVALTRCVAAKLSLSDIVSQLPALSQLPPLPPQACAALNSALAQATTFDFAGLLNFLNVTLPTLPSLPGLSVEAQQQLAQLQTLLSQLQTMFAGQLGFLQSFLQGQIDALLSQAQAQLAIVCPPG
ncbi:MAG: hypothetical protein QOD60_226 [Solirubrobacterales bacterium]|jgi:hypothetical protein|nr:hypothetical protein [Solirubrobacterales bacterium]